MSSRSERLLRAIADGDWWRANAACRGSETDLWFDRARWSEALIYCQNCPVANLCLDYGLKFEREFGIWGGFTPTQRTNYRAELRAYTDSALRQSRWGPVPVLGSDDALDDRQRSSRPGDCRPLGGSQVGQHESAEERLRESE